MRRAVGITVEENEEEGVIHKANLQKATTENVCEEREIKEIEKVEEECVTENKQEISTEKIEKVDNKKAIKESFAKNQENIENNDVVSATPLISRNKTPEYDTDSDQEMLIDDTKARTQRNLEKVVERIKQMDMSTSALTFDEYLEKVENRRILSEQNLEEFDKETVQEQDDSDTESAMQRVRKEMKEQATNPHRLRPVQTIMKENIINNANDDSDDENFADNEDEGSTTNLILKSKKIQSGLEKGDSAPECNQMIVTPVEDIARNKELEDVEETSSPDMKETTNEEQINTNKEPIQPPIEIDVDIEEVVLAKPDKTYDNNRANKEPIGIDAETEKRIEEILEESIKDLNKTAFKAMEESLTKDKIKLENIFDDTQSTISENAEDVNIEENNVSGEEPKENIPDEAQSIIFEDETKEESAEKEDEPPFYVKLDTSESTKANIVIESDDDEVCHSPTPVKTMDDYRKELARELSDDEDKSYRELLIWDLKLSSENKVFLSPRTKAIPKQVRDELCELIVQTSASKENKPEFEIVPPGDNVEENDIVLIPSKFKKPAVANQYQNKSTPPEIPVHGHLTMSETITVFQKQQGETVEPELKEDTRTSAPDKANSSLEVSSKLSEVRAQMADFMKRFDEFNEKSRLKREEISNEYNLAAKKQQELVDKIMLKEGNKQLLTWRTNKHRKPQEINESTMKKHFEEMGVVVEVDDEYTEEIKQNIDQLEDKELEDKYFEPMSNLLLDEETNMGNISCEENMTSRETEEADANKHLQDKTSVEALTNIPMEDINIDNISCEENKTHSEIENESNIERIEVFNNLMVEEERNEDNISYEENLNFKETQNEQLECELILNNGTSNEEINVDNIRGEESMTSWQENEIVNNSTFTQQEISTDDEIAITLIETDSYEEYLTTNEDETNDEIDWSEHNLSRNINMDQNALNYSNESNEDYYTTNEEDSEEYSERTRITIDEIEDSLNYDQFMVNLWKPIKIEDSEDETEKEVNVEEYSEADEEINEESNERPVIKRNVTCSLEMQLAKKAE